MTNHPNQAFSFCMYCGRKSALGDLYCQACGRKLQEDEASSKEEQNQHLYERAIELLELNNFAMALSIFEKLTDYKDSQDKANQCILGINHTIQKNTYRSAVAVLTKETVTEMELKHSIRALQDISDFEDAPKKIAALEDRLEQWYKEREDAQKAEQIRIAKKKRRNKRIAVFSILAFLLAYLTVLGIVIATKQYTITYDYDGGTVKEDNVSKYCLLTNRFTLINPTREGYTFIGWTGSDLETPTITVDIRKWTTGDRSYKANWQLGEYTITFEPNGGTLDSTTKSVTFSAFTELPVPTKDGYEFVGWYVGDTKYQNGEWKETKDITLTAKWKPDQCSISYQNVDKHNGFIYCFGSESIQAADYDEVVTLPVPTRNGYDFIGWYNGETKIEGESLTVTESITLTPKWEPKTFTVNLNANGGQASNDFVYARYERPLELPTPTRTGYLFDGWYDGDVEYTAGPLWYQQNDITLVAKWTPKTYLLTLNDTHENKTSVIVTLKLNYFGSTSQSITLTNGQLFEYPDIPIRPSYRFAGWYTDILCTTAFDFTSAVTTDITLYAKWISVQDGFTFPIGDSMSLTLIIPDLLYYPIVPLVSETITVYTTGDIDTAGYLFDASKTKKLIYNNDGGEKSNFSYSYSVTAGTLYYIGIEGYALSVGSTKLHVDGTSQPISTARASCSDTHDFYYDSNSTATNHIAFGTFVTLPTLTRDGYTFLGWYNGDEKVESGVWNTDENLTLTPRWEAQ